MSKQNPPPPAFQGKQKPVLSHFGICVADLEKSADFYCNVFGYKRGARFPVGPEVAHLVGLPAPQFDIQMVTKEGQLIELICPSSPAPIGPAEARPMNQLGVTHLNFRVEDVDAILALVEPNGGKVLAETMHENPKSGPEDEGGRLIFCTDPDGTRIELMEISDATRFDIPWE